uniref:Uncharacterized protein n=1 Tax=Anguilla anguilla TaxID=7936 RepID=A0A0E9WKA9_ANGAN
MGSLCRFPVLFSHRTVSGVCSVCCLLPCYSVKSRCDRSIQIKLN